MLKTIQVVDRFAPPAVARAEQDAATASWDAGLRVTSGEIASREATDALRRVLTLPPDRDGAVTAHLVRIPHGVVDHPVGDGPGWVGLHLLAGVGAAPTAGGLSVMRPVEVGVGMAPEWVETLHVPVELDRLVVFRRSLTCGWIGGQPKPNAQLLARAFLVPDRAT